MIFVRVGKSCEITVYMQGKKKKKGEKHETGKLHRIQLNPTGHNTANKDKC